ncbi:GmrSD restriction endonuclease domain-containing protein [Flavimobilis soli]|uniref:GmrSD restriction endonuclease domain-containing protein n=1 Tax=Flavimobilis soli TaxID=442709 RepID=UPI001FE8281F|nr:DUF1524 domain-containing protein [Flavimobilis soli]
MDARPFPLGFTVTVAACALLGLTSGIGGLLVLGGTAALVWTIVASVRRRQVLKGRRRGGNALIAIAATVALVVGSPLVETSETDAPSVAAPERAATEAPAAAPTTTQPLPSPSPNPAPPAEATPSPTVATPSPEATETANSTQVLETPAPSPSVEAEPVTDVTTAEGALAQLRVKGRAPKTGYDRDRFRYRAVDLDRNGCDTRNDILRRDLRDVTIDGGTHGCVVLSGKLDDPYSSLRIAFTRGTSSSNAVQIDHVVALSDAWQKGAQAWDDATFASFGNDPLNLLAVDGPLNSQKGDGDAATWLPPNKAFRCQYVARQIAVKRAYDLWVTSAEKDAMTRVLAACPGEPLPTADAALKVTVTGDKPVKAAPKPTSKPTTAKPKTSKPKATKKPAPKVEKTDPNFGTCKEAKSHGYGPYYASTDPEYHFYRDRDGDGIVCE